MRLKIVRTFVLELYRAWSVDKPARLAAALAYYGLFSLAPVIFIAFTLADIFLGELATADQFFARLETTVGPETAVFLQDLVINVSKRTSSEATLASLIGFGALLYAASGLFSSLQYALNVIWKAPPSAGGGILGSIRKRLIAFGAVIGVGLILIVATLINFAVSIVNAFVDLGSQTPVANLVSVVGLATLSFAVLYKVLPDVEVAWRDVWVGAGVAALLFAVGGWLLGFYLSHSNFASAFEAAGAMAVLLVAMYYFAQMFLFGALFSKVFAHTVGSKRAIMEEPGGRDEQSANGRNNG